MESLITEDMIDFNIDFLKKLDELEPIIYERYHDAEERSTAYCVMWVPLANGQSKIGLEIV
ncbi:hypothetical protein INT80_14155 [Gallibacterium anatis]|uniref:Uncharacterized protein n=1 Tax=Gallibacterium anatis TaxID=750 RepID=A0A930UX11_9PAST|nr:hypothetical protein [Gallibacterium anatis]